jgi:hypothetical protein
MCEKKASLPENEGRPHNSWSAQEKNNSWFLVGRRLSIVLVFVQRKYTLRQFLRIVPFRLVKLYAVFCFSGAYLPQ